MKKFCNILGFILLVANVNAQSSLSWQKLYNSSYNAYESGRDICRTPDGNFIIAGLIYLGTNIQPLVLKINPYGDTLWLTIINNNSISEGLACAPTNDGGCVLTGRSQGNFAIQLNNDGTIKWTRFYGSKGILNYDINRTIDGGYILGGNQNGTGHLIKIDSMGSMIWEKTYDQINSDIRSAFNAIDGGFIIMGTYHYSMDTSEVFITKLDLNGNLVWEKKHNIFSGGILNADILNNGYLIGGTGIDTNAASQGSSFIARIDINGNLIFSKIFYTSKQEYFYDIKKINENRYVMAVRQTFIPPPREDNAKLYITDSFGNIIYEKIFPNDFFSAFRSVLPLSNGDIMAAGIYEFGFSFPQRDIYVARTDSMLNSPPLSISTKSTTISNDFRLYQNFPNPFNPTTTISLSLNKNCFINLKVFDITGKEIKVLINEYKQAGSYDVEFDAANLPSGVYFYSITADDFSEVKKMVLVR